MSSTQPAMSTSVPRPVRIRPRGKVPQQERLLCAMQPNQDCEDDPEQQIELIRERPKISPEESRLRHVSSCHSHDLPSVYNCPYRQS